MTDEHIKVPQSQPDPPTKKVAYVSFSAEIVPKTTEALLGMCADLSNKGVEEQFILLLSTPGGSVMHGLTIYNTLKALPFKLITHNVGSVNSIGNVIFLAGDERYCCPTATFMFHGVGFDVNGHMRLEEKNLKERLDSIRADQKKISQVIIDSTSIDTDDIEGFFLEAL